MAPETGLRFTYVNSLDKFQRSDQKIDAVSHICSTSYSTSLGEDSPASVERSSENKKVSDTEPPLKDNKAADIMTARELHESLKKIYQHHVVHSSRTLDRYYSSLQKIEERDRSQVVTFHRKKRCEALDF